MNIFESNEEPFALLTSVDLLLFEFVLFFELSHVWYELRDSEPESWLWKNKYIS